MPARVIGTYVIRLYKKICQANKISKTFHPSNLHLIIDERGIELIFFPLSHPFIFNNLQSHVTK